MLGKKIDSQTGQLSDYYNEQEAEIFIPTSENGEELSFGCFSFILIFYYAKSGISSNIE